MIASGSDGVTEGFIEIFEESTNNSLIDSTQAISSVLNQNGIFNVKWSGLRANGKLIQGKNYFARLRLQYQGGPYMWGVVPFQITGALDIQAIQQSLGVTTGQTIVGEVQKVLGVTGGVGEETIAQKISEVKGQAINILTAAETTIPAKITEARQQLVTAVEQEVKPHVQSGILNRDTTVKQGDAVEISYRTTTGLSPTVTVYDPKNRIRVNSKPLLEIGTTGVYTYKVTFLAAWGTGDFTVVCTEATQGTADALVMTVTQTNIEEVSGQVAAVLGSTTGIGGLRDVADTLNTQFNAIDSALTKLSTQIIGKVQETKGAISNLESVFTQLEAMSKQIRSIGGTTGINLEKLYNVSKDKKGDITYLKNKAQELKAAMEISQKLIENAAKKPVVQTWFEFK
jgi:shikimate kinase